MSVAEQLQAITARENNIVADIDARIKFRQEDIEAFLSMARNQLNNPAGSGLDMAINLLNRVKECRREIDILIDTRNIAKAPRSYHAGS